MPLALWIGSAVAGMLLNVAGTLVGRVLVSLGIGVVTYTGMSLSLNYFKDNAVSALLGLPAELVGVLALMKVGVCISMVMSAILMRLTLQGMTSDTLKSWAKV
jgi:hypothetical protein